MTDAIQTLDDDQRKVLPKIEALLRLADKQRNSSPAEAASAAAKAQELLVAYNLDASLIGSNAQDGKREEKKLVGGFYQYQRDLFEAVAELNFCLYYSSGTYVEERTSRKDAWTGNWYQVNQKTWKKTHNLIGRRVNVLATQQMAAYLLGSIERLTEEFIHSDNKMRFSRRAVSFREGCVSTITNKLYERRQHLLDEEARKAQEAKEAAERAGRAGVSTSTALTLASFSQSEDDANRDFVMGEGWSAKKRAERAAAAEARRKAQEEYTAWAAENPEEARAQEEAARKEREKAEKRRSKRSSYSGGKEYDAGAYYAGRDAARSISLDQQMQNPVKGKLS